MKGNTKEVALNANHISSAKIRDNLNKAGFQITGRVDRNDFGVSGPRSSVSPYIEKICNIEISEQE